MISELLGTFADNGLSPECIDGALHLLAPCGVSIPSSYTTFVTPIASPKLHTAILARLSSHPDIAETPSWAWLKSFDYLSRCAPPGDSSREVDALLPAERKGTMTPPDILPVWSFSHGPLRETREAATSNSHNARHAQMHFSIQRRGVCHGLAGYFECVLYPGFELSTNPNSMDDKSPNMTSWFSMFFPLQVPLYIPDDTQMEVNMWRQTDGYKVWYEWVVGSHKVDTGRSGHDLRFNVGELQSGHKNGYIM